MVTKTKLGLLCAALMMILGTQGVDAQLLRQDQMVAKVATQAPSNLKASKKSSVIAESNVVKDAGLSSPMNRAPRRANNSTTADVTHTKAWFQNKTYTWKDANDVSHTANYTDAATDPYQIYYFLNDVYSNKDIPGLQYSEFNNEIINYRWPYIDYYSSASSHNLYMLGWGLTNPDSEGRYSIDVEEPVENGYTPFLVKVKDDYASEIEPYYFSTEDLIGAIGDYVEDVELLTDGLRVDEGGSQAGTVFTYSGELNRFFFISKGKDYEIYTQKVYGDVDSVVFTGTSTYSNYTLSGHWSGRYRYYGNYTYDGSRYAAYYIPSGYSIQYTVPAGISNSKLRLLFLNLNSGYYYISDNHGTAGRITANAGGTAIDLDGPYSTGDVITIKGVNSSGSNANSPYMTSYGIYVQVPVGETFYPTMRDYADGVSGVSYYFWGYAPFYDMFEEFSPTTTATGSEITDFYPKMMQGDVYPIEHDCTGVIALEHFFSMSGKDGTESKSLSNLVFYIPDNRANEASGRNYGTTPPTVGLYVIQLDASIAPDDEHKDYTFDVTVDWESSLNNITNSDVPQTYELHAYWTDPVTGVEKDSIIYTGPNTSYSYEVPQYMASYTIDYKVKATPTNATNPDEFYAWSNIDDVIVPGYDDFFMLDRDHYESDFVITSEKNFYRNYLYPKNKDVGGFTPLAIESGMKHFILYRQSTDEGGEPVPAADLYFETANGKVYYKIEYRDEYQHPINSNNN